MSKATELCKGCRNDFYNGRQNVSGTECWSLKDAKTVTRWKIHWWTQPTVPGAFTKVKTYDCWHSPGNYALYDKLPDFAEQAK